MHDANIPSKLEIESLDCIPKIFHSDLTTLQVNDFKVNTIDLLRELYDIAIKHGHEIDVPKSIKEMEEQFKNDEKENNRLKSITFQHTQGLFE